MSKVSPRFCVNSCSLEEKGWDWAIYPLTALAKYSGIDLNYSAGTGTKRIFWIVFGPTVLLMNCASQIVYLYVTLTHLRETSSLYGYDNSYQSTTTKWITVLDACNYGVHNIILHVLLFTVVRCRWKHLLESFSQGGKLFEESFFIRLRRSSILGVCLIVFEIGSIILNYMMAFDYQDNKLSRAGNLFMCLGLHYHSLVLCLYFFACFTASSLYESVKQEFKVWASASRDNHKDSQLWKIKSHHVVACETVDAINCCFGWTLLFSSSFLVMSLITYVFTAVGNGMSISKHLTLLVYSVTHILLLCYSSDSIRNKADELLKELVQAEIDPQDPAIRMVHDFINQLVQSTPRISAAGYFIISKKMIPKIVGTILTYFFILYQFHQSEKGKKP